MMDKTLIREILGTFGSYDQAAAILKTPKSTVYFWMRNGNIPHWRRNDVLKAAKGKKIALTEQAIAYLKSDESAKDFLKEGKDPFCSGISEQHHSYTLAANTYEKDSRP